MQGPNAISRMLQYDYGEGVSQDQEQAVGQPVVLYDEPWSRAMLWCGTMSRAAGPCYGTVR